MNTQLNVSKLFSISLIVSAILGCGSETDSTQLAKEVELEKLRQEGTIIESLSIENYQVRLKEGDTHQLKVTGIDSNGESRDVTNEITWQTSDESIAKINSNGLLTALKNSPSNQGLITISATTINDISDEKQISIADVAAESINLKQVIPATGSINTCTPARVSADITYVDGYTALNSLRDINLSVDENTTAKINQQGFVYTSAAAVESTVITAAIGNVTDQLSVVADPSNLKEINVSFNSEQDSELNVSVGDRIQLAAKAVYQNGNSEQTEDISSSIKWSAINSNFIGLTPKSIDDSDSTASFLALKPGTTQLLADCGTKQKITTVQIEGDAELDSLEINDGSSEYSISPLGTIELKLFANYSSNQSSLNVTEFANWSINNSNLVTTKLVNAGTAQAGYRVTSTSNTLGTVLITVQYDTEISSVLINIE